MKDEGTRKLQDMRAVREVLERSPEIVVATAVGWLQRMLQELQAQSRATANMVETLVKSRIVERNERQ